MREKFDITDEAGWLERRKEDITSTDCAVLFGKGKYKSYYALWQEKHRGIVPDFKVTDRVMAGKHLERGIATLIAEKYGLGEFDDFDQYIRIPEYRMASSFDFLLKTGEIFEIKNVDQWEFKDEWNHDEVFDVIPAQIEYQIQQQLWLAEKEKLILGVLVGGNLPLIFRRDASPTFQKDVVELAKNFWHGPEPEPNYETEAADVIKVHQLAEPGHEVEVDDKLAEVLQGYQTAKDEEKEAKKKKDRYKAEALVLMGEAERAKGNGFTVTARMVSPKKVSYEKKGYRDFRVYQRD